MGILLVLMVVQPTVKRNQVTSALEGYLFVVQFVEMALLIPEKYVMKALLLRQDNVSILARESEIAMSAKMYYKLMGSLL